METAGFPPHMVVLAATVKGEVSVAPFEGAATVMLDVVDAAWTLMFSRTCEKVPLPQHFTCNTCEPDAADTLALNDVGSITSDPLSME